MPVRHVFVVIAVIAVLAFCAYLIVDQSNEQTSEGSPDRALNQHQEDAANQRSDPETPARAPNVQEATHPEGYEDLLEGFFWKFSLRDGPRPTSEQARANYEKWMSLVQQAKRNRPALQAVVRNAESEKVRNLARVVLIATSTEEHLEFLIEQAQPSAYLGHRLEAVETLEKLGRPEAVVFAMEIAEEGGAGSRAALRVLKRMGDPGALSTVEILLERSEGPRVTRAVAQLAAAIGTPEAAALVLKFAAKDATSDMDLREMTSGLARFPAQVIFPFLREKLPGLDSARLRNQLIFDLAKNPDKAKALEFLNDVLISEGEFESGSRRQAIHALGQLGTPEAAVVLYDLIDASSEKAMRQEALSAILNRPKMWDASRLSGILSNAKLDDRTLLSVARSLRQAGGFIPQENFAHVESVAQRNLMSKSPGLVAGALQFYGADPNGTEADRRESVLALYGELPLEIQRHRSTLAVIARLKPSADTARIFAEILQRAEANSPEAATALGHLLKSDSMGYDSVRQFLSGIREPNTLRRVAARVARSSDPNHRRIIVDLAQSTVDPELRSVLDRFDKSGKE